MTSKLYGYDLDGTLCEKPPRRDKPYFKQTGPERREYEKIRREHYRNAKLLMEPKEPFVIITGRSSKYRIITEMWCVENGLKPEEIFMLTAQRTRKNMIAHKIEKCKRAGVDLYFEDDPKIARAMTKAGIPVVLIIDHEKDDGDESANCEEEENC